MSLLVQPKFSVTLAKRTASSSCCGAKLDMPAAEKFTCRACGQPCDRILSEPEEITADG